MDVDAYLARIGADRGTGLRELHRLHQTAVPFENLSIHLGERISLDGDDLFDKVVRRGRGGFCYELNGLFALLLEELGYQVTRMAARVFGGERFGPPFDHLALLVGHDGDGPWLVDVGFGSHSTYPLRPGTQDDPSGTFTLTTAADGDIEVGKGGRPEYRAETRARDLADFVPTCWWQVTSPESHFTAKTVCSRIDGDGRVTISGRTLIKTNGLARTEEELATDEAMLAAYRDHFGIVLDRVPQR